MRLHNSLFRHAAVAVAVAGFATTTMHASQAQAAPVSPLDASGASALVAQIGAGSAGTYLDSTGRMIVTVTNHTAAEKVHAAGGTAKLVRHNGTQLRQATDTLNRTARIPGTSWALDPATNQVVVSVYSTVSRANLARLNSVLSGLGDKVRVERVAGNLTKFIAGGDAIRGAAGRCSLGFNVRDSAGAYHFLTAGHCGNVVATWYADAEFTTLLGDTSGSSFPDNDYALVKYTNSAILHPGTVNLYNGRTQDITKAADAYVGQSVKRSGSTTFLRSGKVSALNATVNYPDGTVYGLIKTNVCAEGGDSGGSLFASTAALGLTSGGHGNCTTGGVTYFQPVKEALSAYGVSVY